MAEQRPKLITEYVSTPMKTLISKIIIFLLIISWAAVAQPSADIVGTWVQDAQENRWTFRPDGTGFMEHGKPKTIARFKWIVRGSVLEVSTAGTSIPYQLVQNGGNRLVLKNQRVAQVYKLRRD